ncbi:MAG: glycosyltransferase [Chloroflexi bacterium]|nr:glycosyltransferase [Chloroflexota bacterium]
MKMQHVYEQADFIIFQSKFCELSAHHFFGVTSIPSQIIFNPVDTTLYQPHKNHFGRKGPTLLLGGNQYEEYRFKCAVQVLQQTLIHLPDTRLIVTGKLWEDAEQNSMEVAQKYLHEYGVAEKVEFTGPYPQDYAKQIFQRADILIHTKYNDPSPNLIPEALASGLPVVYSASGGIHEMVGSEAGVGIDVEQSWDKISVPDPIQMGNAVLNVWENIVVFSDAARQRATDHFPLENFIRDHQEIFSRLIS